MAYSKNQLTLLNGHVGGDGVRVFLYKNTDADDDSTITGSGYFSDGVTNGMRKGDLVDAVNTGTPKYKRYQVASVSGAAATVAAPTAIT